MLNKMVKRIKAVQVSHVIPSEFGTSAWGREWVDGWGGYRCGHGGSVTAPPLCRPMFCVTFCFVFILDFFFFSLFRLGVIVVSSDFDGSGSFSGV